MKKTLLLLTLTHSIATCLHGQTPLPYYTGFDSPSERLGWVKFRMGASTSSEWEMGVSTSAVSPPNALSHDYPVGAAGTDTTIDWLVSPGFNFHAGGKIDSFKINVYDIIGHASATDSIVVYLLKGSNNPATAISMVRLADLTAMVTGNDTMKDTGNFVIPPTPGTSYIAFKYYVAGVDWFIPTIDNIYVHGNATTQLGDVPVQVYPLIYPNPAKNTVHISFPGDLTEETVINIINIFGEKAVIQKAQPGLKDIEVDITDLPEGLYFIAFADVTGTQIIQKVIVAR